MKVGDIWMPLVIGDYLGGTRHLTTVQHGAYLLLLMASWRMGPLPDDDRKLATMAGLSLKAWQPMSATIRAFFSPAEGGGLVQKRLLEEREKVQSLSQKRAMSGAAGGRNKAAKAWENKESDLASATVLPEQTPSPHLHHREDTSPANAGEGEAAPRRDLGPQPEARPVRTALPLLGVIQGGGDAGAPESEAERIKRQLWTEGVAIVARLAPTLPLDKVRELIGQGAKALGGGTQVIQALRDVELHFATASYGGDPVKAIRGFLNQRAGTGKAAKAAALAAPETATEMKARLRAQGAI